MAYPRKPEVDDKLLIRRHPAWKTATVVRVMEKTVEVDSGERVPLLGYWPQFVYADDSETYWKLRHRLEDVDDALNKLYAAEKEAQAALDELVQAQGWDSRV